MQSDFYKQEESVTKLGKCHFQIIFTTDLWICSFIGNISCKNDQLSVNPEIVLGESLQIYKA